jgi:methylenetetrahydrofolate dehydrogenase (NADP+)/methenyltetrahydrofolate cyclohydrolase
VPGLAVVLVGEDPASEVYVAHKHKQTVEVGMASFEHKLPADTSEDDLFAADRPAERRSGGARHPVPVPRAEHLDDAGPWRGSRRKRMSTG